MGGGEQLCLLPAHEELSQLNYPANSSGVRQPTSVTHRLAVRWFWGSTLLLMVLEAPQTCIRLQSHPGNGSGGNLGGLEEEDLLHSLWDGQAASVWKTLMWV